MRPCDSGRPCDCRQCYTCRRCGLRQNIKTKIIGPRGGLNEIRFKCICNLPYNKSIKRYNLLKNDDENYILYDNNLCSICKCKLKVDIEEIDKSYTKCIKGILMNIPRKYIKYTYHCENETDNNHKLCLTDFTCKICNEIIEDPNKNIKINNDTFCCKCYCTRENIRCKKCNDIIDNGIKSETCNNCELKRIKEIKEESKPIFWDLCFFYFDNETKKWISRWDNNKWEDQTLLFGKYKGIKLKDLITKDLSYCIWMKNKINFDEKINEKDKYSALCYMLNYSDFKQNKSN